MSLSIVVLDNDRENTQRNWKGMLGCCGVNDVRVQDMLSKERPDAQLLVVHRSSLPGAGEEGDRASIGAAVSQLRETWGKAILCVIMSTKHGCGKLDGVTYERRTPVGGAGQRIDEEFCPRFSSFVEKWREVSEPHFELLEPPAWPEHLVALYLLAIAPKDAARQAVGKLLEENRLADVVRGAWSEHVERKGTVEAWKAAGLPECWKAGVDAAFDWTEKARNWSESPTFNREKLRECIGSPSP
jgi:hypothetical protein